ncbi:hypothetical protein ACFLX5_05560 [Chloroflexota bacterium]
MELEARCGTTAMGIMPHTDVEKAMELALGLDIPYWPQLPNVSFNEDMYVQTSENFPGITVDRENQRILFSTLAFEEEVPAYSEKMELPETFALGSDYSAVYRRFLDEEYSGYRAIRGQVTGPVSFGFKVADENSRPIIYDDGIRTLLFDFIRRKADRQYRELVKKNGNAFVWLDEPGMGWVFSSLSGYNDVRAKEDYRSFLADMEDPRAMHLCANVGLPYLLELGLEVLSFDTYQMEAMPGAYAEAVAGFMAGGGIVCWGIVPTDSAGLGRETPAGLVDRLSSYWEIVSHKGGPDLKRIAELSLVSPARCCLRNIDMVDADHEISGGPSTIEERLVERAFDFLHEVSRMLIAKYCP